MNKVLNRIGELIKSQNISQRKLAADIGVCESLVSHWCAQLRNPSKLIEFKLKNYFELKSIEDLYELDKAA